MNNEVVLEQDDSIRSRGKDDVRSKKKGKESVMNDDVFFSRVEKIRQKMYAIAYSYFCSETTACDLVDDAIYRGYLKKKTLKNEDFFETWMIRILLNLCATQYKKAKKHRSFEEYVVDHEPVLEPSISRLELSEALSRLPDDLQKIISLKYFAGYATKEIAEMLDIPIGTVGTRVRRALDLLRIDLGGEET
ncbi:MAG: sigma-70 family RNA polymerase sigma factor [Clostridiales bacterium]|nr:sigma-70 family RNA polymerase sigma factor [Clostridiales bacterium]